jgi:hypothetical protein
MRCRVRVHGPRENVGSHTGGSQGVAEIHVGVWNQPILHLRNSQDVLGNVLLLLNILYRATVLIPSCLAISLRLQDAWSSFCF